MMEAIVSPEHKDWTGNVLWFAGSKRDRDSEEPSVAVEGTRRIGIESPSFRKEQTVFDLKSDMFSGPEYGPEADVEDRKDCRHGDRTGQIVESCARAARQVEAQKPDRIDPVEKILAYGALGQRAISADLGSPENIRLKSQIGDEKQFRLAPESCGSIGESDSGGQDGAIRPQKIPGLPETCERNGDSDRQ